MKDQIEQAIDQLVEDEKWQRSPDGIATRIIGNVTELRGPGCAWKALVQARDSAGNERFFIGTVKDVQKVIGSNWHVWDI